MTRTELRVEALKLAVATVGNSNNLELAAEYLSFMTADFTPSAPQGQQQQQQPKKGDKPK